MLSFAENNMNKFESENVTIKEELCDDFTEKIQPNDSFDFFHNIEVKTEIQIKEEPIDEIDLDVETNQADDLHDPFLQSKIYQQTAEILNLSQVPAILKSGNKNNCYPGRWRCTICRKEFSLENDLKNHLKTALHDNVKTKNSSKNQCDLCGKSFSNVSNRNRHVLKHVHEGNKLGHKKCEFCEKVFSTIGNKNKHVYLKHIQQEVGETEKNGYEWRCQICEMSFYNHADIENHQGVHEGEREKMNEIAEHRCNLCKRLFAKPSDLKRHMAYNHNPEQRCNLCRKLFAKKSDLKRHMSHLHNRKSRTKCDFCEKTFVNIYSLQVHLDREVCQQNRKLERALETAKQTANINAIKSIGKV